MHTHTPPPPTTPTKTPNHLTHDAACQFYVKPKQKAPAPAPALAPAPTPAPTVAVSQEYTAGHRAPAGADESGGTVRLARSGGIKRRGAKRATTNLAAADPDKLLRKGRRLCFCQARRMLLQATTLCALTAGHDGHSVDDPSH